MRTDISATLFLSGPDEYDGGELMIEDAFGAHSVKLPAGHMVVYPASSLHRVEPVTRGSRWASFFWIQSIVRDDAARTMLFDMDMAINGIAADMPDHPSVRLADQLLSQPDKALGGCLSGVVLGASCGRCICGSA